MILHATLSEVHSCTHRPESKFVDDSGQERTSKAHYLVNATFQGRRIAKATGRQSIVTDEADLKSLVEVPAGRDVVVEVEPRVAGRNVQLWIVAVKSPATAKKPS